MVVYGEFGHLPLGLVPGYYLLLRIPAVVYALDYLYIVSSLIPVSYTRRFCIVGIALERH